MKGKKLSKSTKYLVISATALTLLFSSTTPSFATGLTETDLVSASQAGQTEPVYQLNANQIYGAIDDDDAVVQINLSESELAEIKERAKAKAEAEEARIQEIRDEIKNRLINAQSDNSKSISSFKDYKPTYWGNEYIEPLYKAGGISGYPDGTLKAENTITKAEFLSIILKSTGKELKIDGSWAEGVFKTAREYGLVKPYEEYSYHASFTMGNEFDEGYTEEMNANSPITRGEAAHVLIKAMDNITLESTSSISTDDGAEYVGDLKYSEYTDDIIKAYKLGLVSGDEGTNYYRPGDTLKRSEACVMINRLLGLSDRATPAKLTGLATRNTPSKIEISQKGNFKIYKEGDMFNGKPLVRDPDTGVLGFDIGGNLFTGMITFTGDKFVPGDSASDSLIAGGFEGTYVRDKRNGYTFFENEWTKLDMYASKNLDKHEGESGYFDIKGNPIPAGDTTTTPYYSWADGTGAWTYLGPSYTPR